jgi:hypothetical protein
MLIGVASLLSWSYLDSPLPEAALASVDGVILERSDLERHLGRKAEFAQLSEARRAVDRLVDEQLLIRTAAEIGEEPRDLLSHLVDERGGVPTVTDEDARARFQADLDRYVHGREVTLTLAGVPIPSGSANVESRPQLRAVAEQVRARARLHPAAEEIPLWIPRDETRAYAVGSGPWSCEESAAATSKGVRPPEELLRVACSLREGRLSPIVETADGFYFAKVRRRSRAWRVPFRRVARQLRDEIEQERLSSARRAALEQLRQSAQIRISPEAIAALVIESSPQRSSAHDSLHPPSPPGLSLTEDS